jgi:hypothetical protein
MKLSITIALITLFSFSLFAQTETVRYSFFVAGHTYGKPGVNNAGFHPPFKQKFNYLQRRPEIKFGVLTGDIVSDPSDRDWDEIDTDIETLGLPVYFAVGNHDMKDRPLFESRYGSTYYHFTWENDLFIVLDPNIDGWNISGEQLKFLQNTVIDHAPVTNLIFVFFHQILWREPDNPFHYISWNSSEGRSATINFWTDVEPVFHHLSNEVFMFAGDLGASWSTDVAYDHYDNITLIASGMGDEDGENFIVVNVGPNQTVNYDLICLSDTSIDCLGSLTDYQVVNAIVGTSFPREQNIYHSQLYPNPTSTSFTFSLDKPGITTIQIFNLQGELIQEERCYDKEEHTINVSHVTKGIYLVRIVNDQSESTFQLIVN